MEEEKEVIKQNKPVIIVALIILAIIAMVTMIKNDSDNVDKITEKQLKLTNKMIEEIEKKIENEFSSSTQAAALKISLGTTYKSVVITKQDLTDAYTYTLFLKATGVNKLDYLEYKINYTAVEDKNNSKGYSIEKEYDFR